MTTTDHSLAGDAPTQRPPDASQNQALRNKWRKRLFAFWIAGSAAVAAYLMIGGPLTAFTGLERPHVALVVVPFMILLLASGLAWLVLLVRSRR
ncbi:MAG: hypothetical protein Kow00114_27910 [Kiloniellaceae bacterium]